MNIQPVTNQASKAEELEALHKVARLFERGTYIHDLFSDKFLAWVERKLKDDFPPEWYEELEHLWSENSKLTQALREANEDMVIRHNNHEHALTTLRANMQYEIDSLYSQHDDAVRRLVMANKEVMALQNEFTALRSQYETNSGALDEAVKQIVELKAKLYDLTQNQG